MGCSHSKLDDMQALDTAEKTCNMDAGQAPCKDAAAVADLSDLAITVPSISVTHQKTTIQDLPPLLLAHIFSVYLGWEELHGSVPLVCQAWRHTAAEVTPQQLSFEFDLVEELAARTDGKPEAKNLLQVLFSQPSRLLQRLTGQLRQLPQAEAADEQDSNASTGQEDRQQQQFLQYLQNAPWERWLQGHGMQLQDFSMSITNLDSNCASAQCQLKETLLSALAQSATARPALSASSSFASTDNDSPEVTPRAFDSSSDAGSSAPTTPLSSSCSEFSTPSSADSEAASTSDSTSSSSTSGSLRLKSLHLKVPLFECDVLLLARGICAKAPNLKALSLVGYSSSGAVKTRRSTGLSTSTSTSSRHRLPIRRSHSSSSAASIASAAAAAAAAASSNAPPRGNDLIPVGYNSLGVLGTSSLGPSSGRGGFITGSSLKQLMASVPQLQSLTFACRQLYKLNWLAPATELTYLSLRDCSLGGDLVKQLAALQLPKLRALDLSGSRGLGGAIAEMSLQQLAKIADGGLQQIDISGWDLSSAAGASRELPHLAALQSLCELKMECCGITGWEVQPGQLPLLTHLSLSGNPLDSRGVTAACSMTQLQCLELAAVAPKELVLLPQQAPGQGPACWSGMHPMPHLTNLNLSGNFWPDNSLPDRSPVVAYRAFKHNLCCSIAAMLQLQKVDLTGCKAPYYKSTHLFVMLAHLPASVTELVLDGAVDGIKRADVEMLQQLPKLRVLSASSCCVRDKHAGVISGLTGLHKLILRDNALGPEGLAELLAGCRQLVLLDVSGNERLSSRATAISSSSGAPCTASVHTADTTAQQLVLLRD